MVPDEQAHHNEDEFDPVVATVLLQLWTASQESPEKPWSLPKLCKRADLPMSTLRRTLTRLQAANLVDLRTNEDEDRTTATLSADGLEFCTQLFRPE